MSKLIALVDGSLYSHSVCDHAAWIAKRNGAAVEVLHVLGRRQAEGGAGSCGAGECIPRECSQASTGAWRRHSSAASAAAVVAARLARRQLVGVVRVDQADAQNVQIQRRECTYAPHLLARQSRVEELKSADHKHQHRNNTASTHGS